MATFTGSGDLEKHSQTIYLSAPIRVSELPKLLSVPGELENELLFVKKNRLLSLDDTIDDSDDVQIFLAAMGG